MENIYRLNVGGNVISPTDDTGLFRSWQVDSGYIFGASFGVSRRSDPNVTIIFPPGTPSYIAPIDLYSTYRSMGPTPAINRNYNLSWIFPVDPGFYYLIRLHFCEGSNNVTKNQVIFDIFLNNQTAEKGLDVVELGGKIGVALHRDYVVYVEPINGVLSQQDLWVDLHPVTIDALLNGMEIFKVNDSTGNLGGPNPIPALVLNFNPPPPLNSNCPSCTDSKNRRRLMIVIGCTVLSAVILLFGGSIIYRRRRKHGANGDQPPNRPPVLSKSKPCRQFSLAEIKSATNDFDEAFFLGLGGFGRVYRGEIDNGSRIVAIKRGNSLSRQGENEFQNAIDILSNLRHRHLVSLIGCCQENGEMILVYDYMANGTLREHLYKTEKPPLPWKQRLAIAIGAARGLHYLHTGAKHAIVHRDVKTTNILLDENWVAKVSDFGLSKTGPPLDHSHVTTNVKGTFGYLDPEYFMWRQLTTRSDVYSFGVVLFEILCACPAVDPNPDEEIGLAGWAVDCYEKGSLNQIMDPYLIGKISPECFLKFAETAVRCVAEVGISRPSMGDVLRNLELALQLQEAAEEGIGGGANGGDGVGEEEVVELEQEGSFDEDQKDSNASSSQNQ